MINASSWYFLHPHIYLSAYVVFIFFYEMVSLVSYGLERIPPILNKNYCKICEKITNVYEQ